MVASVNVSSESNQPTVAQTIEWLQSLGLPPLPVAPTQNPHEYPLTDKSGAVVFDKDGNPKPKFTGKNPSYVDGLGIPQLIGHSKYQKRGPNDKELASWFAIPKVGIGSLGSDKWVFIDLDAGKFESPQECDAAAQAIIEAVVAKTLSLPPYEKTQSGGWRIVIGLRKPPTFTNFAVTPNGNHVGEVLGKGRFAVLAPTVGPSGNAYVCHHRCAPEDIPVIESLEEIGLYPTASKGKKKPSKPTTGDDTLTDAQASGSTPTPDNATRNDNEASSPVSSTETVTAMLEQYPQLRDAVLELSELGTPTTQDVLDGTDVKDDRSCSLTLAIKDWYGWENWCRRNGITYRGDTHSLALAAGEKLGIDAERVGRILDGIDDNACLTAVEFRNGNDEGCWKKVLRLAGVRVKPKKSSRKRKSNSPYNNQTVRVSSTDSSANGKVVPLPTAYPKAVGSIGSPPLPPRNGGGRGGNDPNNDEVDWKAPVAYKGHLGYWMYPTNKEPYFDAKCDFDFAIDRFFIRHKSDNGKPSTPDGGGFRLKVTYAEDNTSDYVYVTAQDFGKADKFAEALKSGLGRGISFRLSTYELQALRHVKVKEYRKRGGKKYRLCDHIGQQVDGTWVFPDVQFDANGNRLDPEETKWVFNPYVGGLDHIPCPLIPVEDNPNALSNLLIAQREFAGVDGFMAFWLTTGYVAASLHDQKIVNEEGYFPILNPCGDPGGGKTVDVQSATSVIWGAKPNGTVSSISLSMAYERLSKLGSVVSVLDDPPNQAEPEKRQLDEFIKSIYNRFARQVRFNTQEPHSALIITSNDAKGATSDAAKSRLIRLYIAVKEKEGQDKAYAKLRKAMAEAPGAFRSLLTIGYDADAVLETRQRLQKHMKGAPGRSVNNLALLTWYTKRVVELAEIRDVDVEAWVIANLCPQMVEEMGSVNSATDFVQRILTLKAESYVGNWNLTTINHRTHGEAIALNMPALWKLVERSANRPTYDRSVLEKVLVDMGCVKNAQAKFDANRDISLAYERELGKGVNKGDGWVPPKSPDKVNLRAILIPQRLWETLGFEPHDPDPNPPDWDTWGDDSGQSHSQVADFDCQVAESSKGSATRSNVDGTSISDSSKPLSSKVAEKKERELKDNSTVEANNADEKTLDATDAKIQNDNEKTSAPSSENPATLLLGSSETPETPNPQALDEVVNPCYFDATSGEKFATLPETEGEDDDLTATLTLAHHIRCCATPADVEALRASFSPEAIEAAKELLGDEERKLFEQIANPGVEEAAADVAEVATQKPVVKRFRYIGVLTHNLKDVEGNPVLDAAGKPLVLKKGSEMLLQDVGGSVNPEYVNVRPIGVSCLPLGIRISQLKEVNE